MASTVIRAASKTGLVLLGASTQVAEDGLVTISANFLAPASGLTGFDLDSRWPVDSLPAGAPTLQGGPFLTSKTARRENGLVFVEATYVSAVAPIRPVVADVVEKASYSGYAEKVIDGATVSGSLSFDYYTRAQTLSYALIWPNKYGAQPKSELGRRFNFRAEGNPELVKYKETEIVSTNVTKVGRVSRVTVTARKIYETDDAYTPTYYGLGQTYVNGAPVIDPWRLPGA